VEKQRLCLVIEDDPDIRGLIKDVLSRAGFDVRAAGTGAEGIAATVSIGPDLITLDLGLPDMNGRDAALALRAVSEAPLLFLTARAEEADVISGLASGADAYLTKPFQPSTLRETALKLCDLGSFAGQGKSLATLAALT
jgi:two-component system, OmpR family, response regulator